MKAASVIFIKTLFYSVHVLREDITRQSQKVTTTLHYAAARMRTLFSYVQHDIYLVERARMPDRQKRC